jgi:hypothetical protein
MTLAQKSLKNSQHMTICMHDSFVSSWSKSWRRWDSQGGKSQCCKMPLRIGLSWYLDTSAPPGPKLLQLLYFCSHGLYSWPHTICSCLHWLCVSDSTVISVIIQAFTC